MKLARTVGVLAGVLLATLCQCSTANQPRPVTCLQGKVVQMWCDNTAVVAVLTPGAGLGERWENPLDSSQVYDNCVHLGYLPQIYRQDQATFYFTYSSVKEWFTQGACKKGGAPSQIIEVSSFSDKSCPTSGL